MSDIDSDYEKLQNDVSRLLGDHRAWVNHVLGDTQAKDSIETRDALMSLFTEGMVKAETRGVAWTVGKIDEIHMTPNSFGENSDRLFKGIKNTIRNDYELLTGVDPAPKYPVNVKLTHKEPKEKK